MHSKKQLLIRLLGLISSTRRIYLNKKLSVRIEYTKFRRTEVEDFLEDAGSP